MTAPREQTRNQGSSPVKSRCAWCGDDPLYMAYHDREWGVPLHDDRRLFEMLILEGAQAGLSWLTILRKREAYRRAFDQFDMHKVAQFDAARKAELLGDAGIVRNRLKIEAAVRNARAALRVVEEFGSLDRYLWQLVGGTPTQNARRTLKELPASTPESDAMSRDLRRRDFTFVGSTICYAFMQSVGIVNDHMVGCYRYAEVRALSCPSGGKSGRA